VKAKNISAVLLAAAICSLSIDAAHSQTIIRKDTTWKAGEVHTGHYQIGPKATLTIEGGATVVGAKVEVAGTLIAGSSVGRRVLIQNSIIHFISTATDAEILIDNASIIRGLLLNYHVGSGKVVVKNSFINASGSINLMSVAPGSIFEGNMFYAQTSLSISGSSDLRITRNTFAGYVNSFGMIAIGQHSGKIDIDFNNFLGDQVALRSAAGGGSIQFVYSKNNWFETDVIRKIRKRILDNQDDLNSNLRFDFRPYLLEAVADAPFSGTPGRDLFYGDEKNNMAFGGGGNNKMVGGKGDDVLVGAAGDDVFRGGFGSDLLIGGAGKNSFVYLDVAESTPQEPDMILGFGPQDRFVLSSIDANSDMPGRQGFVFIGYEPFSGNPGELRIEKRTVLGGVAQTVIYGNTNVDPAPEFMIILDGNLGVWAHSFKF